MAKTAAAAKAGAGRKAKTSKPAARTARRSVVPKTGPAVKPTSKPAAKAPKPAAAPARTTKPPSAAFSSIAAILSHNPGIAQRKMFGAHGLSAGGHVFTFEWDGRLVVRLPPARVTALTAAGAGTPFDPGMGRPSKGWLTVAAGRGDWQRLAEEALAFAGTLPPK